VIIICEKSYSLYDYKTLAIVLIVSKGFVLGGMLHW